MKVHLILQAINPCLGKSSIFNWLYRPSDPLGTAQGADESDENAHDSKRSRGHCFLHPSLVLKFAPNIWGDTLMWGSENQETGFKFGNMDMTFFERSITYIKSLYIHQEVFWINGMHQSRKT